MQNYVLTLTMTTFYIDFKYILVLFRCSLLLILTWKYQTVQLALLVFCFFSTFFDKFYNIVVHRQQ